MNEVWLIKLGENWKNVKTQHLCPFNLYIEMNAEKQILGERIRERETHNLLYVLKSISLRVNGRLLLSSVYKHFVQYKSRGHWKESWQGLKALCSLDPALAVRTWVWRFIKIWDPGKHYPTEHAYPTESSTLCLIHKSLTVFLAIALVTGWETAHGFHVHSRSGTSQEVEWKMGLKTSFPKGSTHGVHGLEILHL